MEGLLNTLIQQGFGHSQALLYITILQFGSVQASFLAHKTGIKRPTVYGILKDLQQQGIVYSIQKKSTTYFQVIDPEQLLKKLQDRVSLLASKLPEFLALSDTYSNKPKIQYFDGLNGVKEAYDDLLSSSCNIQSFLSLDELDDELLQYLMHDFLPKRLQVNVFAQVLVPKHTTNESYIALDEKYFKQTKVIESPLFDIKTEINLYGPNKVMIALFNTKEMSAIIIHSPKLYTSLQSIFSIFWNEK